MDGTKHSLEEAMNIQKSFESKFSENEGVVGVGLGMNQKQDDLAINVFVTAAKGASVNLPHNFEGLEVVIDVVDDIKAL